MKEISVWEAIYNSQQAEVPVSLLIVTQSSGSSPGRQGFKMAVMGNGEISGSIGGGIMEYKLVEMTRKMLLASDYRTVLLRQIHSKSAHGNQSGMICSGEQTVAIVPVHPADAPLVRSILDHLKNLQQVILQIKPGHLALIDSPETGFRFDQVNENDWTYRERIGWKNRIYIVGGGHVSLALSRLMATLDFKVIVLDDRSDLVTMEINQFAHQRIQCTYDEIRNHIEGGANSYVVLMTFGYRDDGQALKEVLDLDLAYLGMMGSQAKVAQLLAELEQEGHDPISLSKVRAPIGIQIKSQTPEEIAISIGAQIIEVKNSMFE